MPLYLASSQYKGDNSIVWTRSVFDVAYVALFVEANK